MTYAGTAHFTERDEQNRVIDPGGVGQGDPRRGHRVGHGPLDAAGQGDQTHVVVHTTLNVTGRPAQFGRGVMAEVGGKLIGIFASNLAEMLAAGDSGAPRRPPSPPPRPLRPLRRRRPRPGATSDRGDTAQTVAGSGPAGAPRRRPAAAGSSSRCPSRS